MPDVLSIGLGGGSLVDVESGKVGVYDIRGSPISISGWCCRWVPSVLVTACVKKLKCLVVKH